MPGHTHRIRVRYAECDAQNVVFNAHYLTYCDIAITELWREAFGSYTNMTDKGLDIMVAEANLRFRSPARFDDEVDLTATVEHMGTTSIVTRVDITRADTLLVECRIRHVCVETTNWNKTPLPDDLRASLTPFSMSDAQAA